MSIHMAYKCIATLKIIFYIFFKRTCLIDKSYFISETKAKMTRVQLEPFDPCHNQTPYFEIKFSLYLSLDRNLVFMNN